MSIQNHNLTRRSVLQIGGASTLGLTLPQLLAARKATAADPQGFGKAKQVIILFLHGGHPQQETFDPKPDGPSETRGEFGAISTAIPGIQFSELLPKCATLADQFAVVRSMSHENTNHVQACLPAQTGHKHPASFRSMGDFPPSDTDFPPVGAVVDHLYDGKNRLPNWVRIGPLMSRNNGTTVHGQTPGFLGAKHSSFAVDQPLVGEDVKIQAVQGRSGLNDIRLSGRNNLREEFNKLSDRVQRETASQQLDDFYGRAADLLGSSKTRRAFDISAESVETREMYGSTEFGQRCLLARRLAEAGVPVVNISYCYKPGDSWDTHSRHFSKTKEKLAPDLDQAFSALIKDLDQRGMADDTLVIVNAEFGRTPKVNKNAGRDHWPFVYSLALFGAGIKRGAVHGASDKNAAYPQSTPIDPADMAATLYHLIGVATDTRILDNSGRPHSLIVGKPIEPVLA